MQPCQNRLCCMLWWEGPLERGKAWEGQGKYFEKGKHFPLPLYSLCNAGPRRERGHVTRLGRGQHLAQIAHVECHLLPLPTPKAAPPPLQLTRLPSSTRPLLLSPSLPFPIQSMGGGGGWMGGGGSPLRICNLRRLHQSASMNGSTAISGKWFRMFAGPWTEVCEGAMLGMHTNVLGLDLN